MTNGQVVMKLKEIQSQIPEIKLKEVPFSDTAEFQAWKDKGIKWLSLGLPHTKKELERFDSLRFRILRMRAYGEDRFDYDDQERYVKDCDLAVTILESAIENIEMDLVPETHEEPQRPQKRGAGSKFGGVSIAQAGTVVMGDRNIVAKIDSITAFDFLKILEKEIQEKVQDPGHKATLLQKIKEVSQNPTVNAVFSQSVGQILRSILGG